MSKIKNKFDNNNSNSKLKYTKLISFLLLINQNIFSN